jgi:hypothetical protein
MRAATAAASRVVCLRGMLGNGNGMSTLASRLLGLVRENARAVRLRTVRTSMRFSAEGKCHNEKDKRRRQQGEPAARHPRSSRCCYLQSAKHGARPFVFRQLVSAQAAAKTLM